MTLFDASASTVAPFDYPDTPNHVPCSSKITAIKPHSQGPLSFRVGTTLIGTSFQSRMNVASAHSRHAAARGAQLCYSNSKFARLSTGVSRAYSTPPSSLAGISESEVNGTRKYCLELLRYDGLAPENFNSTNTSTANMMHLHTPFELSCQRMLRTPTLPFER